jgi:hypothetical protein
MERKYPDSRPSTLKANIIILDENLGAKVRKGGGLDTFKARLNPEMTNFMNYATNVANPTVRNLLCQKSDPQARASQ